MNKDCYIPSGSTKSNKLNIGWTSFTWSGMFSRPTIFYDQKCNIERSRLQNIANSATKLALPVLCGSLFLCYFTLWVESLKFYFNVPVYAIHSVLWLKPWTLASKELHKVKKNIETMASWGSRYNVTSSNVSIQGYYLLICAALFNSPTGNLFRIIVS